MVNTVIFTHGDADGICSGAIALAAHQDAHILFSSPYSILEDLSKVKDSDKVIICDISLPEDHLTKILKRLFKIAERGDLTYIDHHPLPRTVLKEKMPGIVVHNPSSSISELTYNLFHSKVDLMHTRTAIYAAFLSPFTHTLDLLKLGTGGESFFGMTTNIVVLSVWLLLFLFIGQMFHKIIMKRE